MTKKRQKELHFLQNQSIFFAFFANNTFYEIGKINTALMFNDIFAFFANNIIMICDFCK